MGENSKNRVRPLEKYRKREEGISEEAEKIVNLPLSDPWPSELIHMKCTAVYYSLDIVIYLIHRISE